MALLALAVLALLIFPQPAWAGTANLTIWGVFVVDYFARLAMARDRRRFMRRNIPDLIAIVPLDIFRVARLARLARLVRLTRLVRATRAGVVLWRVSKRVRGILHTNGLGKLLVATTVVIACGGAVIWWAEPGIATFQDGVWWSIVTATTVGYGDISPSTSAGRIVAVVLMLVGIGTVGMITGSIATYFLGDRDGALDPDVEHIRQRLARWQDLSDEDRKKLVAMLALLADEGVKRDATSGR